MVARRFSTKLRAQKNRRDRRFFCAVQNGRSVCGVLKQLTLWIVSARQLLRNSRASGCSANISAPRAVGKFALYREIRRGHENTRFCGKSQNIVAIYLKRDKPGAFPTHDFMKKSRQKLPNENI